MAEAQVIAGRYEVGPLIGHGGMGDVFRGTDLQTGETVAIKSLKPDIVSQDPGLVERFEREGETLARVNHPSIVRMLATAQEGDQHFIIMEYVPGGSLSDLLDEQPKLPISRVLEIAIDLADALTRAHRLGIIHRDIKPANVLLAEDGTPRLTDFGTAHIGDRTRLTEAGTVIGTYAYLSPEACNALDLDGRTDIWSFGIMLYEMLAGRRPFDQMQPGSIITAILTKPVESLDTLRPESPPALNVLIYSMLEKDRDKRINSVRLVGAELEQIIQHGDTGMRAAESLRARLPASPEASRFADSTPSGTRPGVPVPEPTQVLTKPAVERKATRVDWRWIVGGLIVLVIVAGAFILWPRNAALPSIAAVEPVAEGEYMVLVAEFEPLRGEPNPNVTRFLIDDLKRALEDDVPLSRVRIREYSGVITSEAQARAIPEQYHASVVVWGNYDADLVQVEVQVGVLDAFPHIQSDVPRGFTREGLGEIANVRVGLGDTRRESAAGHVMTMFGILHSADGNGYELMRTIALLDIVNIDSGETTGNNAASFAHRFFDAYFDPEAQEEIDTAIARAADNPILYASRSALTFRQSQYEQSLEDIGTAARLGPEGWTLPLYLQGNFDLRGTNADALLGLDDAIATYDQIVELRPEDWFPLHVRGSLHYLNGDIDQAAADFDTVLTLHPDASFPYTFVTLLALRDGRLGDAADTMDTVLTTFPDPSFGNRILATTSGDMGPTNIFGPLFSAYGNLALGQYEGVVSDTQAALFMNGQLPDLYLIQGVAHCNLGDAAAAEDAYSRGIDLDPSYAVLYLLRGEVRLRQGDDEGAADDFQAIEDSSLAETLAPLVEDVQQNRLNCQNLFTFDYASIESN